MSYAPGIAGVFRGFPRPEPGRPGDPGPFGPGSMVWKLNGETVTVLGGGRALLMQIAHPMVAAGVADHSDFARDPFERLWRTLDAVLTVGFGDTDQAGEAAARVNQVHGRVTGARGGRAYRALDPELLLWVFATLVDSASVTFERFVRPIPPYALERYYEEMKGLARAFLVPDDVIPASYRDFARYLDDSLASIEVTDEARALAPGILGPPAPRVLRPLVAAMRSVTVGLLPPRLRDGFGLAWSPRKERALDAAAAICRAMVPLLPAGVRQWPHATAADRRVRPGAPAANRAR